MAQQNIDGGGNPGQSFTHARRRAPAREIFGWAMFDFANSSYTTIVITLIFSIYFMSLVVPQESAGLAEFYWSLGLTLANLLAIVLAPLIGAMADYTGHKKRYLIATCLVCVVGTAMLYFTKPGMVIFGIFFLMISLASFSLGEGLCSSYLPELAPEKDLGKISGLGWGLGYIGGLVVIALCLPLMKKGFSQENILNLRLTCIVVSAFFLVAALPTFILLKDRILPSPREEKSIFVTAYSRVLDTLGHLRHYRNLFMFFIVMLAYNAGLTTVIAFSTYYAKQTLGFSALELVWLFLVLQITASLGAVAFGFIQDRIGIKKGIAYTLWLWVLIIIGAFAVRDKVSFYVIANFAGLGLGSCQAATRAFVAFLTPKDRIAQAFGFMTLFWKLSYAIGPLAFGLGTMIFKSQRLALIVPLLFFLGGLIGLARVKETAPDNLEIDKSE